MAIRVVTASRSLRAFLPDGVEGIAPTSLALGLAGTQVLLGPSGGRTSFVSGKAFTHEGGAAVTYGFMGNGSSQVLACSSVHVSQVPFTFAVWVIPGTLAGTEQYLFTQGQVVASGGAVGLRLVGGGSDDVSYVCRTVSGLGLVNIAGGAAAVGVPCLIVGRTNTETDHRLFFNGVSVGNSTTALGNGTGAWSNTIVGALRRDTTTAYSSSRILSWAAWDRGLHDSEILSLYTDPWRMYWIPGRTVYFDTAPVVTTARSYGYIFG
jgi:hypothetical protein